MAKINFGGVEETVVTREEFPLEKAKEVLKNETIAVIGYGIQGPGQGLNLRDNGFNVIVGQRKESKTWDKAVADGWIPGETLFDIEEAAERATIIEYLLSDAAQIEVWPRLKKHRTAGKALYFSHGFAITYKERTGIVPPADVDVIMVAPKGSGTSLRRLFVQGRGINSSFAVFQDATGRAKERCLALGIGIGSGYMFETDFKREVYSDLTGERGTLIGAIQRIFAAQYDTLRAHGHTPSEAFNESIEELTQSLMELGACVCVPNGAPKCAVCPLRTVCLAEKSGAWASLPVKEAKKPRRIEEKTVFFLQCGGQYAVRKRPETGLLAGLWELPNVEGTLSAQQALALLDSWGLVPEELTRTRERTHIFTHVEWHMRCYDIRVSAPVGSFTWVSGERFRQDIALPSAFRIFWQPEEPA